MSKTSELDYQLLFDTVPQSYVVFRADDPDFTVAAENHAHEAVGLMKRERAIGKPVLQVWPDTSEKYRTTGVSDLIESFRKVIRTGKPDDMGVVRYDLHRPDGKLEQHYWRLTHYPFFDKAGKLTHVYQATTNITEEIRAGRKLDQAQRQLDEALSVGLVGTWLWDLKEDYVVADKNLLRLFGIDPKEAADGLPLKTFTDSIHTEDRARVIKIIERTIAKKSVFEAEYRTVAKGGEIHWVIARGRVESDEAGTPVRFPGVIVDITERIRAEENFSRQLILTKTITSSLGEGVYALDKAGNLTYLNHAAEQMLGYQEKELLGKNMHDAIHSRQPDGSRLAAKDCTLMSVLRSGKPVTGAEDYFMRKDGSRFPVNFTSAPIVEDGDIAGAVLAFTDITEAKQTELNLRFLAKASEILSSSLDYQDTLRSITRLCVPDIADWCSIDLLDGKGKLQQVAVGHKDPKKISWARAHRVKSPVDMDAPTGIAQVLRSGKPEYYPVISDEILAASAKNQEELDLLRSLEFHSAIIVPIKPRQKTVGTITFVSSEAKRHFTERDLEMAEELGNRASAAIANAELYQTAQQEIAARAKLEEQLRQANEQLEARVQKRTAQLQETNRNLERSNQELQDFAYVASHDLQEPLRKIQAFGNLLQDEYGDKLGEGKDYLDRMRNAASRMSGLIEDLLMFSRITTKANPLEEVDLNRIAQEVLGDLEVRIKDTAARVKVGRLPMIEADQLQMRQLFQNLLGNALKFSRPGIPPVVRLRAELTARKDGTMKACQLFVEDNGIGFDEKYLDRIFSVFQRLHGKESYQGTGIGLAICRKIVERHGGTITAKSTPGKGSTFIISLPGRRKGKVKA